MKITTEKSLRDFEFWSGAVYTAENLTDKQLDQIESYLEDAFPDGVTDTEVNDFFWFENDQIAEWLGFEDWETFLKSNEENDEEN